MKDLIVVAALVVTFAALVTTHVLIAGGLARRKPRARAVVALVVFPLAPYFALREKMRVRAVVWLVLAAAYGLARAFALA
jgi:hypothetical protein